MPLSPWRGPGRRWLLLPLVVSLGVIGCGGKPGSVSGVVSYKGTPLKGGNVTFVGADGRGQTAAIGEDGRYSIPQLPVGQAKISVETESLKKQAKLPSYKPPKGADTSGGYKPPDPEAAKRRYTPIPPQYADANKSGLTYTVKSGNQDFPIDLK